MSAQDQTLRQYHQWMQLNAVSHIIRSAREVGLVAELREGQRTIEELCEAKSLLPKPTGLLLDALVAIGFIEKYGDDYALSRAGHLLCQYDDDLGDQRWQKIAASVQGKLATPDDAHHFDQIAATQWAHTPAAIQASEILDLGGEDQPVGLSILDLGCGSAVWSSAFAHRDPNAKVTGIDHPGAVKAAKSTAESIGLGDRFSLIEADPNSFELEAESYDMVILAERLHGLGEVTATALIQRASAALRPDGRLVIIDLFRGPTKPNLSESIEALKLELDTQDGSMRTLKESEDALKAAGLSEIQFSFLAASEINLGLMVGVKKQS